jgi:hypothetical protein
LAAVLCCLTCFASDSRIGEPEAVLNAWSSHSTSKSEKSFIVARGPASRDVVVHFCFQDSPKALSMPHPGISSASRKDRKVRCKARLFPEFADVGTHFMGSPVPRGAMKTPPSTAQGQSMCIHWNSHWNEILRPYPSST